MPVLVANTLLPLVLYAFYCRSGLFRLIAFLTELAVFTCPSHLLYLLNSLVSNRYFIPVSIPFGLPRRRLLRGSVTGDGQGAVLGVRDGAER